MRYISKHSAALNYSERHKLLGVQRHKVMLSLLYEIVDILYELGTT